MSLQTDEVLHVVQSETSNRSYEVRLRSDGDHYWLSCQCKSWTTGRHNFGKMMWERRCKHTDATIIEAGDKIRARHITLQRGESRVESPPDFLQSQTPPIDEWKIEPRRVLG